MRNHKAYYDAMYGITPHIKSKATTSELKEYVKTYRLFWLKNDINCDEKLMFLKGCAIVKNRIRGNTLYSLSVTDIIEKENIHDKNMILGITKYYEQQFSKQSLKFNKRTNEVVMLLNSTELFYVKPDKPSCDLLNSYSKALDDIYIFETEKNLNPKTTRLYPRKDAIIGLSPKLTSHLSYYQSYKQVYLDNNIYCDQQILFLQGSYSALCMIYDELRTQHKRKVNHKYWDLSKQKGYDAFKEEYKHSSLCTLTLFPKLLKSFNLSNQTLTYDIYNKNIEILNSNIEKLNTSPPDTKKSSLPKKRKFKNSISNIPSKRKKTNHKQKDQKSKNTEPLVTSQEILSTTHSNYLNDKLFTIKKSGWIDAEKGLEPKENQPKEYYDFYQYYFVSNQIMFDYEIQFLLGCFAGKLGADVTNTSWNTQLGQKSYQKSIANGDDKSPATLLKEATELDKAPGDTKVFDAYYAKVQKYYPRNNSINTIDNNSNTSLNTIDWLSFFPCGPQHDLINKNDNTFDLDETDNLDIEKILDTPKI